MQHHRRDLHGARKLKDREGEGKAYGNLGNTYKMLGALDKALDCYQRHLKLATALDDKEAVARAYDNLGNAFHALGNACSLQRNSSGQTQVQSAQRFNHAVGYYRKHMTAKEVESDKNLGRACGNLGTT